MSDPNSESAVPTSKTDEVFGSDTNEPPKDTSSTESSDPFLGLVGEGAKFKTPEDLAKAKLESDSFIEQLKSEAAGLREELEKRPSREEILDIVKATREEQGTHQSASLDEDAIGKLVESRLSERETRKVREDNLNTAAQAVLDVHGDNAADVVKAKAIELGTSVDYLMEMASSNPNIFYATMGLKKPEPKPKSGFAAPSGNSEAVASQQAANSKTVGTWGYYEEMRKSDPSKYFSPSVQNEIFKARKEKGEDFYK